VSVDSDSRAMTREEKRELIEWMRARPQLHEVFKLLPPACTVRALRPLVCPAPGEEGNVVSYTDDGQVSVVVEGNPIRGFCDPTWLEPIGFTAGITPEWVLSVLRDPLQL